MGSGYGYEWMQMGGYGGGSVDDGLVLTRPGAGVGEVHELTPVELESLSSCTDGSHLQAGREQEEREAGEGEGEGELWRGGALLAPNTHHLVVRGQTLTMSPASLPH